VHRIHGDPATNAHNPAGPDRDLAASAARLDSWLGHWERDGVGYHAVERVEDATVVGFTGVRHADAAEWDEAPEALLNLYYRFAPGSWGRGLATEAVTAALDWADAHRPDRPVVVVTRPGNRPSLGLARKVGFEHWRDISYGGAPSVEYRRP
jgi:RimJ/RimL family protein N-acetyltransferase